MFCLFSKPIIPALLVVEQDVSKIDTMQCVMRSDPYGMDTMSHLILHL